LEQKCDTVNCIQSINTVTWIYRPFGCCKRRWDTATYYKMRSKLVSVLYVYSVQHIVYGRTTTTPAILPLTVFPVMGVPFPGVIMFINNDEKLETLQLWRSWMWSFKIWYTLRTFWFSGMFPETFYLNLKDIWFETY
jgi:hypothetical protein